MSKVCQITGKKVMHGNNVSHSNKKTKRTFEPNLKNQIIRAFIASQVWRLIFTEIKIINNILAKTSSLINLEYFVFIIWMKDKLSV